MLHKSKEIWRNIVVYIYYSYIEWVARTSEITLEGNLKEDMHQSLIIGFWHGDSLAMNLLLRKIQGSPVQPEVIITADSRGDYIQGIIHKYGGHALRMPDGMAMRYFFKSLKERVKQPRTTLCIALDGPTGPYHEPKKLGAILAHESMKNYVVVKVIYTRCIRLMRRWDQYSIPLPYSKVRFVGYNKGQVTKEQLSKFSLYQQEIIDQIG